MIGAMQNFLKCDFKSGSTKNSRELYCFTLEGLTSYNLNVALLSAADTLTLVEIAHQCSTAAGCRS